jgi:predicted DNA-binding transcriptional regulator AlpA
MSPPIAAQSIPDTATSAGISRSMLYQLIQEGRGPRVARIGRRSVVLIEDRDRWLQSLVCNTANAA